MVAMKAHGDGLKHLEAMTIKCGEELLQKIKGYGHEPFDPFELLGTSIGSIMLSLVYGQGTDEEARKFIDLEKQGFKVYQPNGAYLMLDILPISRFILPSVREAYAEFTSYLSNCVTMYGNITEARRKLYKHPQVEYFMDHFLKLSITNKLDEDKSRIVDDLDIQAVAADMFAAGFHTTARTLQMMVAILVNHPEIQNHAYMKIDEVIGRRNPTIGDRPSLPFIEALILETLRYHSIAPFAIPHQARCDAELNGYFIPEGMLTNNSDYQNLIATMTWL